MKRCGHALVLATAIMVLLPLSVRGQATPAGVVTQLEGTVTATRAALPQPVPLKFKDGVFVNDRIVTGDRSVVRMLLGGRAMVTVRERSSLTITEAPGRSTVNLDSGKIALAVVRERMRAGESIEIRTPNAVAGIRGTVVIADYKATTAPAGGVTTFFGLKGTFQATFGTHSFLVVAGQFAAGDAARATAGVITAEVLAEAVGGLQMPTADAFPAAQVSARDQAVSSTVATFGTRVDVDGAEQLARIRSGGAQPPAGELVTSPTNELLTQNPLQPPILPGGGGVLSADPGGTGTGTGPGHGRGCPPGLAKQGRC
jgi:hypothetical protein